MTKKITSLKVVRAGSSPDVDSDINTERRPETIQHVTEIYGNGNVASIGTFSTLAAKGAFKTMCTIYEIPYAQANKITELIPAGGEGGDITLSDMYDPTKDAYEAAADFRSATSGGEWEQIIEGAMGLEGKNKTTGVHPCGIVISSKPLLNTIPLQVRQDDGLVVTQWSYPELESLGLIKMDFLGLDTVDLIQHTVENIMKNGKTPPNMLEIIHGPMDDKKTFEILARGETIGLFQLASPGVQDLLKRIKPTSIDDIIATTALYRPGPMGVQSHIRYADRKNGKEEIDFIHSDFKGTAIEEILGNTYGLVVFQEQIIRIANQIAGMTLQEGDDLRSAMGKKKMAKMLSMKPKFIEGGKEKGYSAEAMEVLWSTCEEFAKYGFNLAHSVAYGINAYQTAFLKTHYPVEFMAALISQNVGNREKVLIFLQEARRMGLKVGSIDVNTYQGIPRLQR
jgi:DNA polymerase-3 subunit alpha